MREDLNWQPTPLDQEIMNLVEAAGSHEVKIFTRRVRDGELRAIVSCDPPDYKWHLSLTHTKRGRHDERHPNWEEVTNARYELLPANLTMAIYLPPIEEVISSTTLRLVEVEADE